MIKEEQLTLMQQEIKKVKLERDNNDKNYNRIFSAGGNRNKVTVLIFLEIEHARKIKYYQIENLQAS